MIFTKVNIISGLLKVIFDAIGAILKYLFKILAFFHLRLVFLICLSAAILQFTTKLLTNDANALIVFVTALVFSVFRSVYKIFEKFVVSGIAEKQQSKKNQAENNSTTWQPAPPMQGNDSTTWQSVPPRQSKVVSYHKKSAKPEYFRVAQNPNYIMAEYPDRYELFYESKDGLKFVRTDYKTMQGNGYEY